MRPHALASGLVALGLSMLAQTSLAGCADETEPSTQLILVADTDIARIDSVEFTVEASGAMTQTARASYAGNRAPLFLSLLREQGPLGPLTVSARGREGNNLVITRTHVLSFVPGRVLVVPLHLLGSCINRNCGASETCGARGCVARTLDETALAAWTGQPPALTSANETDAGATTCGNDGMVNLQTDARHCGRCNSTCRPNEQCSAGECAKK